LRDAPEPFQVRQVLDLVPEPGPTSDGVVVGQGNDIEALVGRGSEEVNGSDA
jgi:hypothetical protein